MSSFGSSLPLVHPRPYPYGSMDEAKRTLAPHLPLSAWLKPAVKPAVKPAKGPCAGNNNGDNNGDITVTYGKNNASVATVSSKVWPETSNFTRSLLPPPSSMLPDGSTLPSTPCVWLGAPCPPWTLSSLSSSLPTDETGGPLFDVDGGPLFARSNLSRANVTLQNYQSYCANNVDAFPLYIFHPIVPHTLPPLLNPHTLPSLPLTDAQSCLQGSHLKPLPPSWLLVASPGSGTPMHDHPLTVSWNVLTEGTKLWCVLPPDSTDGALGFREGEEEESAREFFERGREELPEDCRVIVQREGEIVYVPAGWFHVVLNLTVTVAISNSVCTVQDFFKNWAELLEADPEMAEEWLRRVGEDVLGKESGEEARERMVGERRERREREEGGG